MYGQIVVDNAIMSTILSIIYKEHYEKDKAAKLKLKFP